MTRRRKTISAKRQTSAPMPQSRNLQPAASSRQPPPKPQAPRLLLNLLLLAIVAAGAVYLLRATATTDRAPPTTADTLTPRNIGPPPQPEFRQTSIGAGVAVLDPDALAGWCARANLPAPPHLTTVEPAVATRLTDVLHAVVQVPSADNLGELGMICESLDAHRSAENYFRAAQAANTADHRWPYYLGCLYQVTGRNDDARAALERAHEIDPDYPVTHARLAQLHLEAGRLDAAEQAAARYRALRPDDTLGEIGLARVEMARDNHDAALRLLSAALQKRPDDFQCHYYLGRALAALGRTDEARRHFAICGELPKGAWFFLRDPLDQQLHAASGSADHLVRQFEALMTTADWPRLAGLAEQIIARRPGDTTMMQNLVQPYRKMGRFTDAHPMLDRLAKTDTPAARRALLRAEVHLAQKNWQDALTAATAALSDNTGAGTNQQRNFLLSDADRAQAHNIRGRALFMLKRYPQAADALQRAVARDDADWTTVLLLAETLHGLGRLAESPGS